MRFLPLTLKFLQHLEALKKHQKDVKNVPFLNMCRGGAKCIAYGVYGDYKYGDYGCFLRKNK